MVKHVVLKERSRAMYPCITVVGAVQGIRPSYPDEKKGAAIRNAFVSMYDSAKSFSPNKVAQEIGKGKHKYGSIKLDSKLIDEPSYADSGESVVKAPSNALVIGNDDYDETKNMGSYGPKCTKLKNSIFDVEKIEKAFKTKGFSVSKLTNVNGQKIRDGLNSAKSSLKAESSFAFYFSGHGTFEGLIGTDGSSVSLSDIVELVKKGIEVNSDLVILIDACHSGILVDACRSVLLERAKEHNKDNEKIRSFIEAAAALATAKDRFHQKALELWKKMWEAGDLVLSGDDGKVEKGSKLHTEAYDTWPKVWNEFVDDAQIKINEAISKGKVAGVKTMPLTLSKFPEKISFTNEHEKQMWAQLDSVDEILNLATSVYS